MQTNTSTPCLDKPRWQHNQKRDIPRPAGESAPGNHERQIRHLDLWSPPSPEGGAATTTGISHVGNRGQKGCILTTRLVSMRAGRCGCVRAAQVVAFVGTFLHKIETKLLHAKDHHGMFNSWTSKKKNQVNICHTTTTGYTVTGSYPRLRDPWGAPPSLRSQRYAIQRSPLIWAFRTPSCQLPCTWRPFPLGSMGYKPEKKR